jgi:hypothetical protein
VVGEAVDLDDEALGKPEHVDLMPADPYVQIGWRQAGGTQQVEHSRFRLRSSERWAPVVFDQRTGGGAAGPARGRSINDRSSLARTRRFTTAFS